MLATCNAYRAHRHGSESPYPGSTPGLNPFNHLAWLACGPWRTHIQAWYGMAWYGMAWGCHSHRLHAQGQQLTGKKLKDTAGSRDTRVAPVVASVVLTFTRDTRDTRDTRAHTGTQTNLAKRSVESTHHLCSLDPRQNNPYLQALTQRAHGLQRCFVCRFLNAALRGLLLLSHNRA